MLLPKDNITNIQMTRLMIQFNVTCCVKLQIASIAHKIISSLHENNCFNFSTPKITLVHIEIPLKNDICTALE